MKKLLFIGICLMFSCNSENTWDCLQAEGRTISKEFEVAHFSKIRIENEVTLYIKHGKTQQVVLETGENLLTDIFVGIEDETLVVKDYNECNLVRDYGVTNVYVTTPNITEIRNSSAFDVIGQGKLIFPELTLISTTAAGPETFRKSGDFKLNITCEKLSISANGQSVFYLEGNAEIANLSFSDEFPRFEGKNLLINELKITQRSANKMIVNPQKSINGKIIGTGDVVSYNRPPIVDVQELFTGKLIFKD